MALEQVGIEYQIKGAGQAAQETKKLEMGLRSQARALDANARSIQGEIVALKGAVSPNRQLIAEKQRLIQQTRLQSQAVKASIATLREEAASMKAGATATKVAAIETDGLSVAMKGLAISVGEAFKPLLLLFGAMEAVNFIKMVDGFNQLQAKVKGSLDSVSEFDAIFQKLVDSSNRSGQSVDAVAQAFTRLRPAAANLGVTNDKLIQFNETFIKMGALAGATSEEVKNAMIQLSQGIASGKLQGDELRSVMEAMPQVARTIAESMGIPFQQFKKAASDGKVTAEQVFNAILKKTDEVNASFAKLPPSLDRSLNRLLNSFRLLAGDLNQATGLTDNLSWLINKLADGFEWLEKKIRSSREELEVFFAVSAQRAAFNAAKSVPGLTFAAIAADAATRSSTGGVGIEQLLDRREKEIRAKYKNKGIAGATKQTPKASPTSGKIKKVNQNKIDSQAIEDVTRLFTHQIEQFKAASELGIKAMGPFAEQSAVLNKQLSEQTGVMALLNRELTKLQSTSVKGSDGQRALKEAVAKVKDDITQQKGAVLDAQNALKKYNAETEFQDSQRKRGLKQVSNQEILDRELKGAEETITSLDERYAERKLKIVEYYQLVQDQINEELAAEKRAYEARIELIDQEIEARKKLNDVTGVKDLQAKKQEETYAFDRVQDETARRTEQLSKQRTRDLTANARAFGEALENSITDALEAAFTGNKPLSIIKAFAKTLYSNIASMLSKAIADRFANSPWMVNIRNAFGNFLNKVGGQAPIPGTQAAAAAGGGGYTVSPVQAGQTLAPMAGKTSALAGVGKFAVAAAAPLAIAGMSLQNAVSKGGSALDKYINFIDPLGFRKLFGLGGKSKAEKQAERAAYQQNTLAPYLNSVVSGADQNDLGSLQSALLQAARGKPGRGSNGMALKRQAMDQIKQMIDARNKTIAEFVKDIKRQNTELADSIELADAQPLEKAAIQHRIELAKITNETKDLLEQYKDSEEAKTLILEAEALKRKQLLQSEQEDFKSKTQELAALLKQRDDAANANVFTRLRSPEQMKKDEISDLDARIAKAALELKGMQQAGATAGSLGSNQILNGLAGITQTNNLQITINQAEDPNAVNEQITRALDAWTRKIYGATA